MIHTVHLHGFMGKKYGKTVQLDVANTFQLMAGLTARFGPGFKEDVRTHSWHLTDGPAKPGNDLGEDEVKQGRGFRSKHIHLLPAVTGASAALRVVIGIVLMVAGVYFNQPWMVQLGAAMALGGVVEMLTKPPQKGPDQARDDKGSYIYNQAVNVTSQGGPIPLLFGRVQRASSVLITTDFSSDEVI